MYDKYSLAELQKIAHARLYPTISSPAYLVLRGRRLILSKWFAENILGNELLVLDIGGRYQPYRPLLEHRTRRYFAIDVVGTPLVDVLGKGEELPFKTNTFDLVIATGVFEYFPEPRVAAAEIYRVIKPGGHLIVSVAAVAPRFVEAEHWRYLPAGLRFVLRPFSKIEIVPEVTSIGGIMRLNAGALNIFAKYEIIRSILHYTVVPALNLVGLALENTGIVKNDQIAGNYCVLAKK